MTDKSDRDEIFDLTVRYATAIDSRQYALLATVFTGDAASITESSGSGRGLRK